MSDIKQYGSSFTFDGLSSSDYYVWISGTGTFDAPEKDVELITIPGRSGDLVIDHGRFANVEITYPCFISKAFPNRFDEFRAAMMAKAGRYLQLTDTYHPDELRLAVFKGGTQPQTGPNNRAGRFDLTFNCKPQRWLTSGLLMTTFNRTASIQSFTINNPTLFEAQPLLRVYGHGSLRVNGIDLQISTYPYEYIDIDCEAMSAFNGNVNLNSYLNAYYGFPTLKPGSNNIQLQTPISQLQIIPRWYTL